MNLVTYHLLIHVDTSIHSSRLTVYLVFFESTHLMLQNTSFSFVFKSTLLRSPCDKGASLRCSVYDLDEQKIPQCTEQLSTGYSYSLES